jgi:hypothetical protein
MVQRRDASRACSDSASPRNPLSLRLDDRRGERTVLSGAIARMLAEEVSPGSGSMASA